jgi:glycine/D-amino acid oxidase-like deaminating enzyme
MLQCAARHRPPQEPPLSEGTCRGISRVLPCKSRILVVGAGVSGLTTALCLRRRGFEVTVVAESFAPQVTSVVAGALWEWPPAVCGHHHDEVSLARSKEWCLASYRSFVELAKDAVTGAFLRPVVFYFKHRVEDSARDLGKMNELKDHVLGFSHDAALIDRHGVNRETGVVDAYTHLAPMVDTDAYMAWLLAEVRAAGCRTGLRPLRRQNVRLEREAGTRIVHNYGHGGSGVTFSWGCSREVTDRVEALVGWERRMAPSFHRRDPVSSGQLGA